MPQFTVDEDLAALVERLAKPKPFENLSFNTALKRVLQKAINPKKVDDEPEQLIAKLIAESRVFANRSPKKVPTPSPERWIASVPELKSKKGLTTWKAICDLLKIDTAGDSARRRLKNWVKANRPTWPRVPEPSGE